MDRVNHRRTNLYEEAQDAFQSMIQQTASVFAGLLILLLITGGAPSSIAVGLSFCLGVTFVAWSEKTRLQKLRTNSYEVVEEIAQTEQSKSLHSSKLYALLVGINDYIDPRIENLNSSVLAVSATKNTLKSIDFIQAETIELVDREATSMNIRRYLWEIAQLATPKDTLVLYFSCHSFHAADTAGIEQEVFLLATDSSIGHPEITGISSREILHVIESTRAKKILVVLDTVISGSIFSNGKPAQADMDLANSLRQGIRDLGVNTTEVLEASELDSYLKAC